MIRGAGAVTAAAIAVVLAAIATPPGPPGPPDDPGNPVVAAVPTVAEPRTGPRTGPRAPAVAAKPLAGVRVALDPGHQLGNARFPAQIGRRVPAGGFSKSCNTTGTATTAGYPEASLTFAVALGTKARLEALGADVFLTRTTNSAGRWGPCVDARGRFGASVGADLTVSIHGDGAAAGSRGFHVIAPTSRAPWTTDIAAESRTLALALRFGFDGAGLPRADYVGGGTALVTRSDLGTLNLSDVPVVLVEVGNMRNASDAARMTSDAGRAVYAAAVVEGIRRYLGR